jgi:tetratricopeptide (TPR) repeat protein
MDQRGAAAGTGPLQPNTIGSKADLAAELRALLQAEAHRVGRSRSRHALAKEIGVSVRSMYAYLSGETLPSDQLLTDLLRLVEASSRDSKRLREARDRLQGVRRAGAMPVLRGLPARVSAFTGRARQLDALDGMRTSRARASAVVISAVSGTAGVGKTALAVQWAHRVRARFPDGCLYIDLRGYDPGQPLDPGAALAAALRSLGVSDTDIPLGNEARVARYRTLLDGRRMLILLDNAFSAEQVRPLLPGSSSCFVVVTSRDALAGLVAREGAIRLELDVLSEEESLELLAKLLGEERVRKEATSAVRLVAQCAFLPLALRVAAEVAVSRLDVSLATLATELDRRLLDMLEAGGDERTAVRSVFSWSYRHLHPAPARAFRLLGLHPGRDFDIHALAALADVTIPTAGQLAEGLVRAHLVQESTAERFSMHDLLRAYASDEAASDLEHTRKAAFSRLFDYYLHAVASAMDMLYSYEESMRPRIPAPLTPAASFTTSSEARAWLDTEIPNLTAIADYAAAYGQLEHVISLSTTISRHLDIRCRISEALSIDKCALAAAREIGDRTAEGRCLMSLGSSYLRLGSTTEALSHYGEALAIMREVRDRAGEGRALGNMGTVYEMLGHYTEAVEYLHQASVLARAADDRAAESGALSNLAEVFWYSGQRQKALSYFEQALVIANEIEDRASQGRILDNLGVVYNNLGRPKEALKYHQRALVIARETGSREGECFALINIGDAYGRLRNYTAALDHHEKALDIARESSNSKGERYSMASLGVTYGLLGHYEEALDHHQQALQIAREADDRTLETSILNNMAEAHYRSANIEAARISYESALALATEDGDHYERARALAGVGRIMHADGQSYGARQRWNEALALFIELDAPEAEEVRARIASSDD